jgi:hypothetical protein
LGASGRTEAAGQVQTAAGFLSAVVLTRLGEEREPPVELLARHAGFGVPTVEQRLEVLRAALLKVKDLQARYGVPFPAMPHLAIPGTQADAG